MTIFVNFTLKLSQTHLAEDFKSVVSVPLTRTWLQTSLN